MNILGLTIYRKQDPKKAFPTAQVPISEAFHDGENMLYKFDDIYNMPYQRAFAFYEFFERMNQRCTTEMLLAFLKKQKAVSEDIAKAFQINTTSGKFDLKLIMDKFNEKYQLEHYLSERVNDLQFDTDTILDIASVIYFDKNETPTKFDRDYCKKKAARWKSNNKLNDFFLQMPINQLLPSLTLSAENLQAYSEIVKQINDLHWGAVGGQG